MNDSFAEIVIVFDVERVETALRAGKAGKS